MQSLETSVRDQISLYVEGFITPDELNDRLPDTVAIDQTDEPVGVELFMLVLGYLAEYQNGERPEVSLQDALREHVSWSIDRSRSSSVMTQNGLEIRIRAHAGTPLQVLSAS